MRSVSQPVCLTGERGFDSPWDRGTTYDERVSRHRPETRRRLNAEYRARHKDRLALEERGRRNALKEAALHRYGQRCARCGFEDARALQIDHVENDGAAERAVLGGQHFSGWKFYAVLEKRGWPDGYQTLCANCNLIKYAEFKLAKQAPRSDSLGGPSAPLKTERIPFDSGSRHGNG